MSVLDFASSCSYNDIIHLSVYSAVAINMLTHEYLLLSPLAIMTHFSRFTQFWSTHNMFTRCCEGCCKFLLFLMNRLKQGKSVNA